MPVSRRKTVADCFKYRNKIGFDVALRLCVIAISNAKPQWMTWGRARVCRVARVIQPYLESIV
jgi:hypothetical protein